MKLISIYYYLQMTNLIIFASQSILLFMLLIQKYKKNLLAFLCFFFMLLSSSNGFGQAFFINPFAGSYFQPKFGINAGTFFNKDDIILDFGLGLEELGYDFSVTANGTFRPYYKTVKFNEGDHLYYQLNEKVIQFTLDIEKRFYFLQFLNYNKIGLYGLLKVGYFYGVYKGLGKNRSQQFALNPGGGLSWQFTKNSRISLGYLYFKQNPFAEPHMIQFKLSLYFNKGDAEIGDAN